MTSNRIYLSPPNMLEKEKEFLDKAFSSNWIAPIGPYIDTFENNISTYLSTGYGCALSSGTAALHLSLKILGISKGDIVICPSLTFSASANVIIYENAKPIFIDSNPIDWTLDTSILEKAFEKYRPKAIITVDLYGNSCNYDTIIELCEQFNVHIIEDAAEALGSEYNGKKLGTFGKIGVFSFNGNKIITTSCGGMLVSENEEYVEKAKFLSSQSKEKERHYEHRELGYNYRMSNLLASIGCGQLLNLDYFMNKRRKIFDYYYEALSNIEGIQFLTESRNCKSNRWLTSLLIDELKTGISRDDVIIALEKEDIESRPVWKPMHLQPFYKGYDYIKKSNIDISASLFNNGICLPSGSNLSKSEQGRIIDIILSLMKKV